MTNYIPLNIRMWHKLSGGYIAGSSLKSSSKYGGILDAPHAGISVQGYTMHNLFLHNACEEIAHFNYGNTIRLYSLFAHLLY